MRLLRRLSQDERIRFLVVGGINTVIAYVLFVIVELAAGRYIGYLGSLYVSFVISAVIAFASHRRITFRVHNSGSIVVDFLRFLSVNLVALAINTAGLPLLVEAAHLAPLAAQAILVVVVPLISYFGHRFFSFRRRP